MSGTPNKRLHEESGTHSSLSRFTHPQDDSSTYSGVAGANAKLPTPSAPSDYHAVSYDIGQEAHVPKVPRTELDSTRSPLVKMYRAVPSSLRDSPIYDHAAKSPSDRVVEPRDSARDNIIRDPKVESRDVKAESKELYQGGKSDKDVRYVSRVDDQKDTKNERDVYSDYRNDVKTDKDHHRALKYPDTNTSSGNIDSWHASRSNVHGQAEVVRDRLNTEEKAFNTEAYEAVSENKVDLKRKDAKNRELGENNKERTEGRNIEMKDSIKEERKDVLVKDKDKVEDMDVSSSTRVMDSGKQKSMERTEKDADNKGFDKDSDDGGADVEGGADRDREAFAYGVQQRKRMLRPRGSPQVANRDSRFRSRSQDNDGKSDLSTVVYRVGECMQELLNMWKEYKSSNVSDKTPENSKSFPSLEIRIPAEHVTATNRQVKGGQLWGTDVYTHDSDLVAVLMHTGYCRPTASPPPPAIQELKATVRILPPQDCYVSALRNNVRSRAWGAAIGCGCSFRVERCHIVKKAGGTIDLEPCLTHTSTVEPTLAPVVVERTMTTRAAASNALRQQRFVREVTLQYNLCNEPWIKYSISAIADKGLKKPLFTSARLKKGEVLYLESPTRRYELCFNGEKLVKAGNEMDTNGTESDNNNTNNNNYNNMMDVFRWSLCKKPLPQTVMRSIGIPLPSEHLQVLEENLDWEDIQWSQTGVWISGKEYLLSRVHFLSPV